MEIGLEGENNINVITSEEKLDLEPESESGSESSDDEEGSESGSDEEGSESGSDEEGPESESESEPESSDDEEGAESEPESEPKSESEPESGSESSDDEEGPESESESEPESEPESESESEPESSDDEEESSDRTVKRKEFEKVIKKINNFIQQIKGFENCADKYRELVSKEEQCENKVKKHKKKSKVLKKQIKLNLAEMKKLEKKINDYNNNLQLEKENKDVNKERQEISKKEYKKYKKGYKRYAKKLNRYKNYKKNHGYSKYKKCNNNYNKYLEYQEKYEDSMSQYDKYRAKYKKYKKAIKRNIREIRELDDKLGRIKSQLKKEKGVYNEKIKKRNALGKKISSANKQIKNIDKEIEYLENSTFYFVKKKKNQVYRVKSDYMELLIDHLNSIKGGLNCDFSNIKEKDFDKISKVIKKIKKQLLKKEEYAISEQYKTGVKEIKSLLSEYVSLVNIFKIFINGENEKKWPVKKNVFELLGDNALDGENQNYVSYRSYENMEIKYYNNLMQGMNQKIIWNTSFEFWKKWQRYANNIVFSLQFKKEGISIKDNLRTCFENDYIKKQNFNQVYIGGHGDLEKGTLDVGDKYELAGILEKLSKYTKFFDKQNLHIIVRSCYIGGFMKQQQNQIKKALQKFKTKRINLSVKSGQYSVYNDCNMKSARYQSYEDYKTQDLFNIGYSEWNIILDEQGYFVEKQKKFKLYDLEENKEDLIKKFGREGDKEQLEILNKQLLSYICDKYKKLEYRYSDIIRLDQINKEYLGKYMSKIIASMVQGYESFIDGYYDNNTKEIFFNKREIQYSNQCASWFILKDLDKLLKRYRCDIDQMKDLYLFVSLDNINKIFASVKLRRKVR